MLLKTKTTAFAAAVSIFTFLQTGFEYGFLNCFYYTSEFQFFQHNLNAGFSRVLTTGESPVWAFEMAEFATDMIFYPPCPYAIVYNLSSPFYCLLYHPNPGSKALFGLVCFSQSQLYSCFESCTKVHFGLSSYPAPAGVSESSIASFSFQNSEHLLG